MDGLKISVTQTLKKKLFVLFYSLGNLSHLSECFLLSIHSFVEETVGECKIVLEVEGKSSRTESRVKTVVSVPLVGAFLYFVFE